MRKKLLFITSLFIIFLITFSFAKKNDNVSKYHVYNYKSIITEYNQRHKQELPSKSSITPFNIPKDAKKASVPKSHRKGARTSGDLLWEDNFEPGGPTCLSYYANTAYPWDCPDEYGDEIFAMRFTPTDECDLDSAQVMLNGWMGSPDMRVTVYDDDGTGLPGTELGHVDVANANLQPYGSWTTADLSSLNLSFDALEDFHIGFSVAPVKGDTLQFLSDDGSSGTGRGTEYWGVWATILDDWGLDAAFLMQACVSYPDKEPWSANPLAEWQWVTVPTMKDTATPMSPAAAHSPTHAWWVAEDSTYAPKSQLISPWMTIPSSHSKVFLQLWYFNNFIDWDGDGDENLEDYFKIYVTDDSCNWHISSHNAYSGNSWWCGSEKYDLYGTLEFFNLTSPTIDLGAKAGGTLTFKTAYEIEAAGGTDPGFDAWDVANVQISEDGGTNWDFLIPTTPAYVADTAYAYFANTGIHAYYPGWAGSSSEWVDASFDLSAYTGEIKLKWVLASDPASTAEGFFIDDVEVTDDSKAVVFQDDADTHVNLIPDTAVPFLGDELTYDYWQDEDTTWVLEDDDQIWTGSLDISSYKGESVQIVIEAIQDFNNDGGTGNGLWVDDVQLIGSNLPQYDLVADFCLVPYPTSVDQEIKNKGLLTPSLLIHQNGWGSSGANCRVDVVGVGNPYDYYANSTTALTTDEYSLEALSQFPYTPVAGNQVYKGWVEATGDTVQANDTTSVNIQVNPANYYELGYNSREWDGIYYTSKKCGTYFTPFSDGIFSTKDSAYVISGVKALLINYGSDGATDVETIEIYDAINDTTLGDLLYTEDFYYTGGAYGTYEWAEFTLSSEVPVTEDFFVIISGTWWEDEPNANYFPLFDNMIRAHMGTGAYTNNTVYYDTETGGWGHSTGDRFINSIVERADYLYAPVVDITISGDDVILNWDAISGATDYTVEYSTDPYTGYSVLTATTGGTTRYSHTDGATGTKYFYKVIAKN